MSPVIVWSLVGLTLAGGYAVESLIWPYATCRRCRGRGRFPSPITRGWRSCRRCGGSGRRIRVGRALLQLAGLKSADRP